MTTMRIYVDLDEQEQSEMHGAVNWYKQNPNEPPQRFVLSQKSKERIVQIGQQFGVDVYPGTAPPIDPSDPGALIKAAPSQWAKNLDRTDAEYAWAVAQGSWTDEDRHRITNWWKDNGVKGRYDVASGKYIYYTYPNGVETEHIDDGSADAASAAISGKPIPGPALP